MFCSRRRKWYHADVDGTANSFHQPWRQRTRRQLCHRLGVEDSPRDSPGIQFQFPYLPADPLHSQSPQHRISHLRRDDRDSLVIIILAPIRSSHVIPVHRANATNPTLHTSTPQFIFLPRFTQQLFHLLACDLGIRGFDEFWSTCPNFTAKG